jgi:hypothetical protein
MKTEFTSSDVTVILPHTGRKKRIFPTFSDRRVFTGALTKEIITLGALSLHNKKAGKL